MNRVYAAPRARRTLLSSRHTALLSHLSAYCRFYDVRLSSIGKLSLASEWASPFHLRPNTLRFLGGPIRIPVCMMVAVEAVLRRLRCCRLGWLPSGSHQILAPIDKGHLSVKIRRSMDVLHTLLGRELPARRPSNFTWTARALSSDMGKNDGWGCTAAPRTSSLSSCLVKSMRFSPHLLNFCDIRSRGC